jgi:HlyD family secretion protein
MAVNPNKIQKSLLNLSRLFVSLSGFFLMLAYFEATISSVKAKTEPQTRNVAASGVVEPNGKEREISAQVVGLLREYMVEENKPVEAGQVIAVIENSEQLARVETAEAQVMLRKAELRRLLNGARPEELKEAAAAVNEADAALRYARHEHERRSILVKRGVSPQVSLDQAETNLQTTEARYTSTAERLAQLKNGARIEDVEAAQARVKLAEAELTLAKSILEKTFIRSPVSGLLLRRNHEIGETVTNVPPTVIAIVGDTSLLKVRAEIDETDVGKVSLGQPVEITSDAFPGEIFHGKVSWISLRMGPKTISSGRPADAVDIKKMQILIDIENARLPVGMRVDTYLYAAPKADIP